MTNEEDKLRYCEDFCPIYNAVESWNKSLYIRSHINCPVEMCNEMARVYTENKEYWEKAEVEE